MDGKENIKYFLLHKMLLEFNSESFSKKKKQKNSIQNHVISLTAVLSQIKKQKNKNKKSLTAARKHLIKGYICGSIDGKY